MTAPAPLSPERLAEIKDLLKYESSIAFYSSRAKESLLLLVADDERLRAELAKYVGLEPTIAEEMQYLSACLDAVYDLADKAKRDGCLGITSEAVEQAAGGDWPRDPEDSRRSIYIDGAGHAWIDARWMDADGYEYLASLDGPEPGPDESTESILQRTGSLREIGRCAS